MKMSKIVSTNVIIKTIKVKVEDNIKAINHNSKKHVKYKDHEKVTIRSTTEKYLKLNLSKMIKGECTKNQNH